MILNSSLIILFLLEKEKDWILHYRLNDCFLNYWNSNCGPARVNDLVDYCSVVNHFGSEVNSWADRYLVSNHFGQVVYKTAFHLLLVVYS
jgi:hypothetical protein